MGKGNNISEFNNILKARAKNAVIQTHWCTVKAVDWDARNMTATGNNDGLDFYEVQLGLGSVNIRPKVGTKCLVGIIANNAASSFLISAEEILEIAINAGESELTVKEEGIILKRNSENLKVVLNDLFSEIQKLNEETSKIAVKAKAPESVPILLEIYTETELINQRLNSILI